MRICKKQAPIIWAECVDIAAELSYGTSPRILLFSSNVIC